MEMNTLLIQLLYQMAYADGKFSDEEKAFISEVIERHDITADQMIEQPVSIPQDEKDRMTLLYYLLFLIRVDGEITQSEKNFAIVFGLQLGFREGMVRDMLKVMEKYLHDRLPPEELVKIIQQYQN